MHDHHFHAASIEMITWYEVSDRYTWVYECTISYEWDEMIMDGRNLRVAVCGELGMPSSDILYEIWIMETNFSYSYP
jgi:hypothetical protein